MKLIRNISILLIIAVLLTAGGAIAANDNEGKKKDSESYAKRVEKRIDRITQVIAEKGKEGVDVTKAKELMVKANDLFKDKKYEDAMKVMDDVARMLGFEPRREGELRQPGDKLGQKKDIKSEKLSDADRKEIKQQVEKALSDAQALVEKEQYKEAFQLMMKAQHGLARLAGIMPNRGFGPGGGQGKGPRMGQGSGPRKGSNDLKITPEQKEKLGAAMGSLHESAKKYVDKFGRDDFIIGCMGDYKKIEQSFRRGEIDFQKALTGIGEIQKKIADKLK